LKHRQLVIFLGIFFLTACAQQQPAALQNNPPRITALSADPGTVAPGSIAHLSVSAVDDDGDRIQYQWDAGAGSFPAGAEDPLVEWTAPPVSGPFAISVQVSDGHASVADQVEVTVLPPELIIDPVSLDFGAEVLALQIGLSYLGADTLSWSAAPGQDWLTVDPAAGTTTTETDLITVVVDRSGLAPGSHEGEVAVLTSVGDVTVPVLLAVAPQPVLAVAPDHLDFGSEQTSREFTITNSGTGTLSWSVACGESWLSAGPADGDLTGGTAQVSIAVTRSGLPTGSYSGAVEVFSNGGQESVSVQMEVAGTAILGNLFFLHHSTGRNLIAQGDVRGWLAVYNSDRGSQFGFWDHDYNHIGLTDPAGTALGYSYNIPGDNTDPDGLYYLWTTANQARNAILANHEVIAFKSCYPASDIASDSQLAQYKTWYLAMRGVFDLYPDKVFLVMSPPPRHRLATTLAEADRARAFADWLGSSEFLAGHPNVRFFDFFDRLAHPDDGSAARNMLRYEYELNHSSADSHPNARANREIAPEFCRALVAAGGGSIP